MNGLWVLAGWLFGSNLSHEGGMIVLGVLSAFGFLGMLDMAENDKRHRQFLKEENERRQRIAARRAAGDMDPRGDGPEGTWR